MPLLLSSIESGVETTVDLVHTINDASKATLERLDEQLKRVKRGREPLHVARRDISVAAAAVMTLFSSVEGALQEASDDVAASCRGLVDETDVARELELATTTCDETLSETARRCTRETDALQRVSDESRRIVEGAGATSKTMRADLAKAQRRVESVFDLLSDLADGEAKVHAAIGDLGQQIEALIAATLQSGETFTANGFRPFEASIGRDLTDAVDAFASTRRASVAAAVDTQGKTVSTELVGVGARSCAAIDATTTSLGALSDPTDGIKKLSTQLKALAAATARLSRLSADDLQAAADLKPWFEAIGSIHDAIRQITKKLS